MVPCQPRQLVILSLPFAALVAFFWFKCRKSSSRSDPGGTAEQKRPVDNSSVNEKTVSVNEKDKPVLEGIVEEEIPKVLVSVNEAVKSLESSLKSLESSLKSSESAVELVFNRSACETLNTKIENVVEPPKVEEVAVNNISVGLENSNSFHFEDFTASSERKVSSPEFELNNAFHSTIIEDEANTSLDQNILVAEHKELELSQSTYSPEVKAEVSEENSLENRNKLDSNKIDKTIKGESKTVELEGEITLNKNNSVKYDTAEILNKEEVTSEALVELHATVNEISHEIKKGSVSEFRERVDNLSTDTGLGSQDLSSTEDFPADMALGQDGDSTDNNTVDTGLEKQLASLGLDTKQSLQRVERDSANHSPAEVMLNSPAISTFSDAHSEGSSDSGKGCSDVVTPPSRTPAGGSSVAGDQVQSIYEFVMPQALVGRLIGRHGVFLHEIRNKTHTNVFIKRHPETNSLKVCAIEGTQQDIDAALKMIRQKFPQRRYQELTLDRVSFIKKATLPLDLENMHLHLADSVTNDVVVSYTVSASHLFLQMPTQNTYHSLYRLSDIMNSVYSMEGSPSVPEPEPDVVCVAPVGGGWYRSQIISVDEETNTSNLRLLDYGGFLTVENSLLRQIRGDFMLLPFQAVECFMANIVPAGGEPDWSEEANQYVQTVTLSQVVHVQVYDYTESGIPTVNLFYTQFYQSPSELGGIESRVVLLNEELVALGFAEQVEDVRQDNGQQTLTEAA